MHLFRLENITFKPLLVIAEDYDHAAEIFMHSLITGLHHRPDADFDITRWKVMPHMRNVFPWSLVQEGRAGMLWRIDEDGGWEHIQSNMMRGRLR